jgi:LDH2 family malate/lactate/ureidoglycolate dehydrogenase
VVSELRPAVTARLDPGRRRTPLDRSQRLLRTATGWSPSPGWAGRLQGFAFGLLVEILGGALAGIASTDTSIVGNSACFLALDPARFVPIDRFRSLMDELWAYVKSSPPTDEAGEVLMPGELEFRTKRARLEKGIPIDDATRDALRRHAAQLGVDWGALVAT